MSARVFSLLPVVLFAFLHGPLGAEEVLTWEDCFQHTAANSLDLSIARIRLKEAETALKSQKSVYYPDVTARASRGIGAGDNNNSNWQNNESVSASVNAEYVLFSGFGNRARVLRTEAELYAEKANFDQTRSNIEYNLRRIFAQQMYTQELITLNENIAVRREDNLKLVEMRYEGGRENKGSLLLKRAQLTEALYDVEEAKRALELARRQLTTLMGELNMPAFTVEGVLSVSDPPGNVSLNELAEQTPTYRSAEADMKAAEQGYTITRSARFPTVTATSSIGSAGNQDFDRQSWSAGLSISLPLFRGGETTQDIIQSGLERERTRLTAEKTMLTLMNDLQDSLKSYRDTYQNMQVQSELLKAAEVRAEVARAQYQQGLISFLDWDTIENTLITRQKSWLTSRRNADQAEAAWINTLGKSSFE